MLFATILPKRSRSRSISVLLALSFIAASTPFQFQPSSRSLTTRRRHSLLTPPAQSASHTKLGHSTRRRDRTSLDAIAPAAALSAIGSPLGSISVLAFVILVHEAGHFLAARSLGINVDEFSVGVGPRIVGVRRRLVDNKYVFEKIDDVTNEEKGDSKEEVGDGIEFSLRALPFGGYVRFPENYNRTLAFEQEDAARKARNEARLMRVESASALEKALESIAAKAVILNVLTLGLLKKWQATREEQQLRQAEEEAQMGALKMGQTKGKNNWLSALPWIAKKKNESEEELDGTSKLSILRAARMPEIDYFDDPNLLQNRPWQERAIVLSGGVVFNILLAFACYFGELTGGKGLPTPIFDSGAVVSQMPSKGSPSFGLLKQGDVILGVNNFIATSSGNSNPQSIWKSQKQISDVISTIRETPEGESVTLTIVHGKGGSDSKDVVSVYPRRNDEGLASIGVLLGPNYLRTDIVHASSPIDAISKAGSAVYELTSETARAITGLLLSFISGNGLPAGASMSGPIGVVKSGADVVSKSDFAAVVAFAASISINLAVVNALPLPALDGGQLAFVLAEAAAGRRIDQRVQEGINAGALLILLFISFGTAVGDVTSIFR